MKIDNSLDSALQLPGVVGFSRYCSKTVFECQRQVYEEHAVDTMYQKIVAGNCVYFGLQRSQQHLSCNQLLLDFLLPFGGL